MMNFGLFALVPLLLVALVVFFVVLFVILARHRTVEQSVPVGAGPAGAAWPGSAQGRWNGEILGTGALGALGGTLGSTFGVFEVRDGVMTFTPEGAPAPDWTTACTALVVAQRSFLSLNGADVSLSWQEGPEGAWRAAACNVSRERINRLMDNDFKDLRERGYAAEFVACLAANGARVGA